MTLAAIRSSGDLVVVDSFFVAKLIGCWLFVMGPCFYAPAIFNGGRSDI